MAGRYPKPTATRIAEGDLRKIGARKLRALADREAKPSAGEPKMPPMSADAKKEWRRIVPELLATEGLLTSIDGDALAAYCEDMAVLRRLRKQHQETGDVVQGPNGPMLNPLLRQIDTLEARCLQHRREFGMSPVGRARVQVTKPSSQDVDLAALLSAPREKRKATAADVLQ